MRTAGNKAFTLVELVIVIAVIGILTTLIVPSLIRAVELARRAVCNSNIRTIVQGLVQYSSDSQEMPKVPVSSWNTRIGTNRTSNPFSANSVRNHSSNLWLLAREEHVGLEAFVCPSTTDTPYEGEQIKNYWDFRSSLRISYGLQSPYGYGGSLSILTPEGVVLVADGSPYVDPSTGNNPGKIKTNASIVDWGNENAGGEQMQLWGNSPNHDSEGQNVGYFDGRAEWQTTANCGKDGDNIYTATNHKTATSPGGNLTAGIKNNENDTLILP